MANVVAYPDLALEKFTGLDPNEDARDFLDIVEKKIAFSLDTRPGDAGDEQDAYDNRQRALFGSILRGPAAQWYQGLAANLRWNDIRDQFIDRFTDDKDKYRRRIEAENIKRQPDEFIKSYIHRLSTAVDRGWPNPTFNDDQRTAKKMEFFVRGLSPPGLKQKAHQFLIENPPATWQQLKAHIATKDLSYAVSSEFTGTASSSVDNKLEIEGIKDQLKELTGLMKDHKINAAYNPNEPRNKQNHSRFCKWCRRSGHTISVCFKYRDHKDQNRKPPQYREKFSDNYNRRSRPREENSYNNRYNGYNQRNNNNRPYSPYPRQFNNRTNSFDRSRSQSFGSRDRNFNNRFNDQNNPNRYNTYNTASNNYNQNRNRSTSIPDRNKRSFSQDNYRTRYQNRPHENKFPSYNNQARSLGDSKPSSRENSRDSNPKVQFSENKIHGYYSDDEGEELTLN